MLFRSSFCSIGAREMLQSSSPEAGESVEKSMKSNDFDEISNIFEHFGGTEAPAGQSYQKRAEKTAPGSENAGKTLPVLESFWQYFGDVFVRFFWAPSWRVFLPSWEHFLAILEPKRE